MKTDLKKLRADAAEAQSKANYRKALGLYEEICERDPTDALAHHRAGELFGRLDRPVDAVRRLREGADLYARQGFLLKAIAVCKMILQIDPTHGEAQAQLVDLYARKADHEAKGPSAAPTPAPTSAAPPPRSAQAAPSTMPERGVVDAPATVGTIEPIALSDSGMWSAGGGETPLHLMGSVLDTDGLQSRKAQPGAGPSAAGPVAPPLSRPTGPIVPPSRRGSSTAPIDLSGARGATSSEEAPDLDVPNPNELLDLGIELPPLPSSAPPSRIGSLPTSAPPPTGPKPPTAPVAPAQASAASTPQKRRSAAEIRGGIPRAPSRGPSPSDASTAPPARPPVTPIGQAPVAASIYVDAPAAPRPPPPSVSAILNAGLPSDAASAGPPHVPVHPSPLPPTSPMPPMPPRVAGLPPPAHPPMPPAARAPVMPGDGSGVVQAVTPGPDSIVRPAAPMPPPAAAAWSPPPPPPPVRPPLSETTSVSAFGHSGRFHVTPITIKPEDAAAGPLEAVEISIDDDPALMIDSRPAARELPHTPLFEGLDPSALRALIDRLEYERFEPGQVITREGEVGDALYVVVDGEVRVVTGNPPREVGRLRDGDFFGEIAIISNFPRTATVIADRDTEVLRLSRAVIWPLIEEYPDFLARLVKFVRDRLVNTLTKTSPLFLALPPTDRAALAAQFKLLEVEEGREIVTAGQRSEGLFVLLGGRCELSVPTSAAQPTHLGPGSIVGEISLLTRQPAGATVRTLNRAWVLWMSPQTFSEVLMTYPTVLEYVHHLAEQRQQQAASLRMP